MFVGSQFCPHCGARAVTAEHTGGATLHCPGCGGDMPGVRVGSATMHQCAQCGSAWLSPDVFASLCADQKSRGLLAAAVGGAGTPATLEHPQVVRYVHSPVCNGIMNRVNFGHSSGIIVDICKRHGVWFERDELRGVLSFIARGGMEQTRAHDDAQDALRQQSLGLPNQSVLSPVVPRHAESVLTMRFDTTSRGLVDTTLRALLGALFR